MKKWKKLLVPIMIVALVAAFTPLAGLGFGEAYADAQLDAPAKVTATSSNKAKIKISWSKVSGAKGYTVYKKVGKKFKAVKSTAAKSFTDKKLKKNKTYTYYVKAYASKKAYGKASVKVTAQTKGSKKANVKKVTLDKKTAVAYIGDKLSLKAKLTPAKKVLSTKVTWTSSDKNVATVNAKGQVIPVGSGAAVITATAHSGAQAVCQVTVRSGNADMDQVMKAQVEALEKSADEPFAKDMTNELAYNENYNDVDTMFRGGGSAAEHATADYIAGQYEKIGLKEVTKEKVVVDGWETGESYMNIDGKINVQDLVSYQVTGTHNPDGSANPVSIRDMAQGETGDAEKVVEGADWSKMQIVNVGTGTQAEYDELAANGVSVEGKIVLAAVNQYTENWIDQPYTEAFYHGAAAIITYQYNGDGLGYGMYNLIGNDEECDTINVQDICEADLIPCGSISPKDGLAIVKAMEAAGTAEMDNVDLKLTCKVSKDTDAYVVTGKIPGTENTGQRILIGGHYDKYHGGVNDDCTAVALSTAIGKAIIDSGYQPKNDIYIVAHCAEEWGRSGAADDWAIGSWEMITEAHPEWQGSTLAFINFEMPAIKSLQDTGYIQTSYEFNTAVQEFLDADNQTESYYKNGVEVVNDHNMGMSDCISYQENGVPTIINLPDFEAPEKTEGMISTSESWFMDRYHTKYDDMSTYSSELMKYNIAMYGGIAEYIDTNPALELDYATRCAVLGDQIADTASHLPEADAALVDQYVENLEKYQEASEANLAQAKALNAQYAAEAIKGEAADKAVLSQLTKDGAALNAKTLKAFRELEDGVMGIIGSDSSMALHITAESTMAGYQQVIADLQKGNVNPDETFPTLAGLNGGAEYVAFFYSKNSYDSLLRSINCDVVTDTWGYNKQAPVINTYAATNSVVGQVLDGVKNPDFTEAIAAYQDAYGKMQGELVKILNKEIKGLDDAAKALQ